MPPSTLVSCLMVTADRMELARRAVACFINQQHANRELVVVDDGTQDYRPMLRAAEAFASVKHVKLPSLNRKTLGELRNVAIEAANGDWC
ncbi:MAG: glycosyltransferase family 2 protein, partial [Acidobacteria bacterium]|nr:glycosyltransferase family 2 protein [Acidobacteriota bacterium]